jgi:hypothetical protein
VAYNAEIVILRPRERQDRYSSDAKSLDYSDPVVIPVEKRVDLQPVSTREVNGAGGYTVASGWQLISQTGVSLDLRSTDRVRHGARVFSVVGDVFAQPHPIRPDMVHHVEATLELVTS